MKKFSQFQHRLRKKKSSIKNSKHCLIYTTRGEIYKTSDRSELEFDTQTLTSQKNSLREFEPIIWIQKKSLRTKSQDSELVGAERLEEGKFSCGGFSNERRTFVSFEASDNDADKALQME